MDAIIENFRTQAEWCRNNGSVFTAELLEAVGKNCEQGGVVSRLFAGWTGDPKLDAVGLRLAGALHAHVLEAPDSRLASLYPKRNVDWSMARVWPEATVYLEAAFDDVVAFLQSPPQTNEVGRSAGLAGAFMWLAERVPLPFHMLELGASAGLNSNWDRFGYAYAPWGRDRCEGDLLGAPRIHTEVEGQMPAWRDLDIATRRACDQRPVDVHIVDERLRLAAYVWPDQFDRMARLEAAVVLAQTSEMRVERADAADWLVQRFDEALPPGLSVVFHSVFLQYPPEEVRRAIGAEVERAGKVATPERQLAWVRFEPESILMDGGEPTRFVVNVIWWNGVERREVVLAEGDPHGHTLRWMVGSR